MKRGSEQIGGREALRLYHSACDIAKSFRPHSHLVSQTGLSSSPVPWHLHTQGTNAAEDGEGSCPG